MICPVAENCQARLQGIADQLPYRKEKALLPKRAGYIYWMTNDKGEVLFEKRPGNGLLGGMTGLPTSEWTDHDKINHISTIKIDDNLQMDHDLKIRHTFTHFHLELYGVGLQTQPGFKPHPNQFWVPVSSIAGLGLPTVFKKFSRLMID